MDRFTAERMFILRLACASEFSDLCVQGEDWEESITTGLNNSLVYLPLLSCGFTAPLSAVPTDSKEHQVVLARDWEEEPMGQVLLRENESDAEDNVLKELLVATVLLDAAASSREIGNQAPNGNRAAGAAGPVLRSVFPMFVGMLQVSLRQTELLIFSSFDHNLR